MDRLRAIILTGVSGSGKSTAKKALEDAGYFCIDNLPVQLLETFLLLCDQNEQISRVGIVMDIRARQFASTWEEAFENARQQGASLDVVFLDARSSVLIRRYSETRRSHPLACDNLSTEEAIERERNMLAALRERATHVIDTSDLTIHDLKRQVQNYAGLAHGPGKGMRVALASFGFKYGLPPESHYVFDARFLPNPYFDDSLRPLTGREPPVARFLEAKTETRELLEHVQRLLEFVLPRCEREGKSVLAVAIGCTGGRHRSVFLVERLAAVLSAEHYQVTTFHRDVERD